MLVEPAPARLRAALTMALAARALDARVRLHLDASAVPAIAMPGSIPPPAPGLPDTSELLDEALAAGVEITLCQTGLALAGLSAAALDPRLNYGGMVSLLAALGDDRLVTI